MRSHLLGVVLLISGCGEMMMTDGGIDAGRRDAGVVVVDAGSDAGMMPVDAGPPPPRYVFGNFTLNGVQHEFESGFVAVAPNSIQFRIGTNDMVTPRLLILLVLPGDAGAGFSSPCGPGVLFTAQHISDAGTAFFTKNSTCMVTITEVPDAIPIEVDAGPADPDAGEDGGMDAAVMYRYEGDYAGTITGSADFDTRSAWDAGYKTFGVTAGTFRITRTF